MRIRHKITIVIAFIFIALNIYFLYQYYMLVTNEYVAIISAHDFNLIASCNKNYSNVIDSIRYASQVGRLDIVSLVVAFLGVGVSLGAFLFYFSVKDETEKALKETKDVTESIAQQIASEIACEKMNDWLRRDGIIKIDEMLRQSLNREKIKTYLEEIQIQRETSQSVQNIDNIED